jgi:CheY-like chemotaxis protein
MAESVLVVDDDEVHNYTLAKLLASEGYAVLTSQTGSAALKLAREQSPCAVLLDINLPDVNGFEVCERLKRDESTRQIVVVFYSATDRAGTVTDHAKQAGAAAFLSYPFERGQLFAVLRGAILRHRRETPED